MRRLVASGGVGQRSRAETEFGPDRWLVERSVGNGVGGEECEDLREQRRFCGAVMAQKRFTLFQREFERETEGGFYLSISFWRHWCLERFGFAKEMRGWMVRPASQPPTCPGTYGKVHVQYVARERGGKAVR